ncbi:hypothetical protein [Parasutterella sp.]|uniref:hypothetical protein n=1 Tax=Parasutterella sp. TaxID=2049037 RepID=UPI003521DD03
MAISFKEQIDNFSNDFYINTAYIPYIVNGPECADGLSADELKKIDDFLDKWSYVDCSEAMLDSPDFGECRICGMQAAVTKATFINKEAVREEEQRRETDKKLSELSSENAETFKQVYESHVSRPEFKEHPRMKEIFRAKLADVFVDAERRGIVLKPEERSIDSNLNKPNKNDMER